MFITSAELIDWQAAETTATTPETSTATATQTTGAGTGWTTATRLGVLAGSAAVLTALTTAARGTKGERPEGAANQTETETDGSESLEGSGAGTGTDTTETDTDTQGGETDTEEDQEDTDAGMPTDQGTDTDEGTDAETSEETPNTGTDTHNPPQPIDPATHGDTDGEDASTDSDGTEGGSETSTATAGTNTNTDNADQQDSDQDNTNTAPAPPVDPNAETEGDSGIDQSGSSTAPDNRGIDPDEGGDNADHEDADSMAPPPPVDQNNTAGSEQNESDGSENEPLTNGVDSTDTDGENSVAGSGPANSPGSVIINGTETEDQVLTATLNDADGLPDGVDIRYQWQRNTGADSAFENIDNATSKTYTLGDGDVGREVRVQVSYTDGNNTAETVTSAPTTAVTNINDEPSGAVTISGQAAENETLTVQTDTLADADGLGTLNYQWQSSIGANGAFDNIDNATGETYTLGDADVGREVRVEVRYTDGNNTDETVTSAPTTAVANINDNPSGSVTIDGTVEEDQTLAANTDNLADADGLGALSYQWQRSNDSGDFENIENATGETYTLGDEDVGREVQVVVSYTDDGGMDESLTSTATTTVTNINDDPSGSVSIDGTAEEDQTLTTNTDNLDDADGLGAFSYQWQRGDGSGGYTNIQDASGETYTLGDEDVGREVQVMVSYTDDGGMDESLTSVATAAVENINDDPTGSVTITGTVEEDQTLTANITALQDADGLPTVADAFTYQWQRNTGANGGFENIENATSETYTLSDADVGRNIRVVVNYTDDGGMDESLTSAATAAVENVNDTPTGEVTISGQATENAELTANTDTLADDDGLGTLNYQWQRSDGSGDFENIANATGETYSLGDADVGRNIRVVVNYTDGRGTDESPTSDATTTVTNINDDPTGSLSIDGTVEEDQTLTANVDNVTDADGLGAFSYQWQRSNDSNGFDNIPTATGKTYTLGDEDVGREVRVQVSYRDQRGADERLISDATPTVTNINDEPTGSVTIDGTVEEDQILTANVDNVTDADGLGSFSYQWQRSNGSGGFEAIENATGQTYTLGDDEVGREVRIQVNYTDANNTAETVTSAPTTAVTNINDVPTGAVTISGQATEDQTLTAQTDTLDDADGLGTLNYQWQGSDGNDGFENIENATGETYSLGDEDVGREVRVQVNYTDGNNTPESLTSDATNAVSNINDSPIGSVTIEGTVSEDQRLTANTDNLADADGLGALSYQWQRSDGSGDFENIANATGQTYTLGDEDVGRNIRVVVNYTDDGGMDESLTSTATTTVTNINDDPSGSVSIDGTAEEDQTLTTNTDNLDDADGLGAFSYQWQRSNGSGGFENIENATGQTYTLGDGDVDREVRVQVNYTDANNTAESLTSAPTAAVNNVNDSPTGDVSIDGTATEDETLTANTSTLDDADGLNAFSYQWQRSNGSGGFENIENATGQTYTLGDADVGREVRVLVSYTDARGEDETVSSDATAAVGNVNDLPTGAITITGTVRGDERLTADITALQDLDGLPDDAAGYNYQWQRSDGNGDFDEIPNATSNSYTLGDADVGREVRVQVSYTDGNNTGESLTSSPTAEVGTANIAPTGGVRIDGTVRQGQPLSADTTAIQDADGLPDGAEGYRYQWQRSEADETFADIEDATEQTYTVAMADVGQRLQVVVSYTDNNGADETLTAATVSAAASNANDPVIDEANTETGTAGDDILRSDEGSQRLNGLGGDDILVGRAGADILDGGDGTDIASYFIHPEDIEINLETGTGKGGNAEGDVLINIEGILGGNGNDRLTGNNKDNQIEGHNGNDIVYGGAGNDDVNGGFGDDTLTGGAGNDDLNGSFGDDRLDGGDGNDTLTGRAGNDLFRFEPDDGSDTITDFGTGDDQLEFGGGLFANLEAVRTATTQTDDGNLEIALSETEILTLEGVTLAALTAETVTTLDAEGNDTTTPPADTNSASDAPAFELDDLAMDEEALMRLAASESMTLPPPEPEATQSASEKLALADPLEPPPALYLFDAALEGYSGL